MVYKERIFENKSLKELQGGLKKLKSKVKRAGLTFVRECKLEDSIVTYYHSDEGVTVECLEKLSSDYPRKVIDVSITLYGKGGYKGPIERARINIWDTLFYVYDPNDFY